MLSYLWLQMRRVAVLVPGLAAAYLSSTEIFPYVHQHVPLAVAVLVTYVLAAYVVAPGIIRVGRLFFRPHALPLYCVTPDGFASDPINIGVLGSRRQLIMTMEASGWHMALPTTLRTTLMTVGSVILNKPFPGMPMTHLYLFGRKQNIGFEQQVTMKGRGHRHHVRFWATSIDDLDDIKTQVKSGQDRTHRIVRGQLLWVGAASRDAGLAVIRHSFQLAHFVDPDTNKERDYTVRRLVRSGRAAEVANVELHSGINVVNRVLFARLFADGKMTVLKLK